MGPAIIGAVAGLVVAWLVAASRTRTEYKGAGYWQFEGPGCFATLRLYIVLGAIGFAAGYAVSLVNQQ